ncbi:DUF2524 family protein [Halalkalibacter akibai]|uniref:Uncharacterized protein n=1 Tax=Halalkalibacter akibai (strain ATCC 43226 / DSM 21942 / CIP 109018 / JCM 9157 / 1139) TaxID=1236973 RepID=W4QQA3_HALA3|nr:DUF2524 family protein [Halalkalibacter akibai]GAE34290.1 hypothetical protein JCM9157_1336 [Halalkalibacter akibai JCM 9157]
MPTDDQIEEFLTRIQSTVDQALTELIEVKIIRENDPTEFAFLQNELYELETELDSLIQDIGTSSEHSKLTEAKRRLNEIQEVMIKGI